MSDDDTELHDSSSEPKGSGPSIRPPVESKQPMDGIAEAPGEHDVPEPGLPLRPSLSPSSSPSRGVPQEASPSAIVPAAKCKTERSDPPARPPRPVAPPPGLPPPVVSARSMRRAIEDNLASRAAASSAVPQPTVATSPAKAGQQASRGGWQTSAPKRSYAGGTYVPAEQDGSQWDEWWPQPRDWVATDRANYGRQTVPRTDAWRPSLYNTDQASSPAAPPGLTAARQNRFPPPPVPGPRGPVAPAPGPPSDVYVGRAWNSAGGWWREQWSAQTNNPTQNDSSQAASSSSNSWQSNSWHAEGWRRV